MKGMQDKVLDAIETAIVGGQPGRRDPNSWWEAVKHPAYANTGRILAQRKTGFLTAVNIGYDFQDRSFSIKATGPGIDLLNEEFNLSHPPDHVLVQQGQDPLQLWFHAVAYDDHERIGTLLDFIRTAVVYVETEEREREVAARAGDRGECVTCEGLVLFITGSGWRHAKDGRAVPLAKDRATHTPAPRACE